jgi:flagellar hook assembly protein FlgD
MYLQEFAERYHESGGTGVLGSAVSVPDGGVPQGALLAGLASFPNPFNPFTNVAFTTRAHAAVSLEIYDATGRLARRLFAERPLAAGYHVIGWDGADDSGRQLPSGVYFARVDARDAAGRVETASHKLLSVQ